MLARLQDLPLAVPAVIGFVTAGAGVWMLSRYVRWPRSAEEKERRRRIRIHVNGRMTEATIFQAEGNALHYGYEVAGVSYDATQDVTALLTVLPRVPEKLIGTTLAKYDPQNPANSIVACEHWVGFKNKERNETL